MRIEDLDPPREQPGASESILHTLEAFGFEWDETVIYQSQRHARYEETLHQLISAGLAYPCCCSRKDIATQAKMGADGWIYPGTCRHKPSSNRNKHAWRFRVPNTVVNFHDQIQGPYQQHLPTEIGDFILKRADGFWAYQLAVVVDDADQGITHVIRGTDLLVSSPRQIALQHALSFPVPVYGHLPIIVNEAGEKLSKQTMAPAIDSHHTHYWLKQTLQWLGQVPDPGCDTLTELWQWALSHWHIEAISPLPIPLHSAALSPK